MDRMFGKDLTNIIKPFKTLRQVSKSRGLNKSTNSLIVRDKSKSRVKRIELIQNVSNCQIYQLKSKIKKSQQKKKVSPQKIQKQKGKDLQLVPHYFKQCLQFLLDQQLKHYKLKNYMSAKQNIDISQSVRAQLIDWIVLVHLKFKMTPASLYATVMIVDKYLNQKMIIKGKVEVLGAAAVYIAAKYQQTYQIPKLSELAYLSTKNISKSDILQMEADIVKILNFQLTMSTPFIFFSPLSEVVALDSKTAYLAQYIMELSFYDTKFLQFKPSILAISSICLANKINKKQNGLPEIIRSTTKVQEKHLIKCIKQLQSYFYAAQQIAFARTLRSKYSTSEFLQVSKIKSAKKSQ